MPAIVTEMNGRSDHAAPTSEGSWAPQIDPELIEQSRLAASVLQRKLTSTDLIYSYPHLQTAGRGAADWQGKS
jgi:hypothetical protein